MAYHWNISICCDAILGAKYGFNAIPQEYIDGLIYKEQLDEVINGMKEFTK